MNSPTETNPVPADLGGYQCVENGNIAEGDLLVLPTGLWRWANPFEFRFPLSAAQACGCRVYRKLPVARQGALDEIPTIVARPSGDRCERLALKVLELRDSGALQMYSAPELAHFFSQNGA